MQNYWIISLILITLQSVYALGIVHDINYLNCDYHTKVGDRTEMKLREAVCEVFIFFLALL